MVTDRHDWSERSAALAARRRAGRRAAVRHLLRPPVDRACARRRSRRQPGRSRDGHDRRSSCIRTADDDPLFAGLPRAFPAQATHLQTVLRAPEGATVLAQLARRTTAMPSAGASASGACSSIPNSAPRTCAATCTRGARRWRAKGRARNRWRARSAPRRMRAACCAASCAMRSRCIRASESDEVLLLPPLRLRGRVKHAWRATGARATLRPWRSRRAGRAGEGLRRIRPSLRKTPHDLKTPPPNLPLPSQGEE